MTRSDKIYGLLLVVFLFIVAFIFFHIWKTGQFVKENELTIPHQVYVFRDKGTRYSYTILVRAFDKDLVRVKFTRNSIEKWLKTPNHQNSEILIVFNNNTIAEAYPTNALEDLINPISATVTGNFNEVETKEPKIK